MELDKLIEELGLEGVEYTEDNGVITFELSDSDEFARLYYKLNRKPRVLLSLDMNEEGSVADFNCYDDMISLTADYDNDVYELVIKKGRA